MSSLLIRPFAITLVALGCVLLSHAADSTALLSNADAVKLLGQPVTGPVMIGPERDDDSPAQATHWIYRAASTSAAVVVSRLDFPSPAEARKYATLAFIKKHNEEEAKVTEEPGVGEKAFWATTGEGCALTFLKGAHIASVALGGGNLGPPESHKAALKAAALSLAAKL